MAGDDPPKVFISYAWEDDEHVAWVKDLATRLRTQDGIDAILDQWATQPGDELTRFMEEGVRASRFVLPVCTPLYKKKFDDRLGGVGYEARNITGEIQAGLANRKVIPIHRRGETWAEAAPSIVLGSFFVNLTGAPYRETAYRTLVDTLRGRREVAPPIGRGPVFFEGPGAAPVLAVPHFSGRETELAALDEQLCAGPARAVCVVASGIGGMGKTTLVRQYVATRAAERFPEGSAWLDGANIAAELARGARRFGWSEPRDPTSEAATTFLRNALHDRAFLVVVDNLPEGADPRLVPVAGGKSRTLITSRTSTLAGALGVPATSLALEHWDPETSRAYLRALVPRLARERDEDLDRLSEFVGDLPLAVHLVARGLEKQVDRSATELLTTLQAEPLGTLDAFAKGADRGVASTFLEAYRTVSEGDQRVLRALAACAKGTRRSVVAAVAGVPEAETADALYRLRDVSLAEFRDGAKAPWTLHDVVRMFVRAQPGADEQASKHLAWVRTHLDAHRDPLAHERLEEGIPEALAAFERALAAADLVMACELFVALTGHLSRSGRYALLVDIGERLLARRPSETLSAALLCDLGLCYRTLGDIPKAIDFLLRALTIHEKSGSLAGQAIDFGNLGLCYQTVSETSKAIDFHQRALAIDEKLGSDEGQAVALGNLGDCFHSRGDVGMAVDLLQRAVLLHERLRNDAGLAATFGSLGICYQTLGEISKSINFLERALAIHEKSGSLRGKAGDLGNLGICYQKLGDIPKAIDYHQLSVAIHEQIGSVAEQADQLGNLGACYRKQGDIAKAIAYHERSLILDEKVGSQDGQATTLGNLGVCYQELRDVPKAIDFHRRALALNEKLGHREGQASNLGNLGLCYQTLGDIPEAIDFHQRSLALNEKLGHREGQASNLGNLGLCYQTLGDIPKAIDFLERAHALHEKTESLLGQAANLGNLALCYRTLGDIPKAIDFLERALAINGRVGSLEGQANQLGNLGLCYRTLGDISKAIDFLERALALFLRMGLDEQHPTVRILRDVLATLRRSS